MVSMTVFANGKLPLGPRSGDGPTIANVKQSIAASKATRNDVGILQCHGLLEIFRRTCDMMEKRHSLCPGHVQQKEK
jgi:hypothetical protein